MSEGGPVTFPAYQATQLGIRSREKFEEWRGLDESKRALIEKILCGEDVAVEVVPDAEDRSVEVEDTPIVAEAGDATSDDGGAVSVSTEEPVRAATSGIPNKLRIEASVLVANLRKKIA